MKQKILCILLTVVLIVMGVLVGIVIANHVNESKNNRDIETTEFISEEDLILEDLDIIKKKPNLSLYREIVKERLEQWETTDQCFIRSDEWNYIQTKKDFSFHDTLLMDGNNKYYYPVLFNDSGNAVLWYTDENGTVISLWDNNNHSTNYIGSLHFSGDKEVLERLYTTNEVTVSYDASNGSVDKWEYGKVIASTVLPNNSVFCGISQFEGLIFRYEGTVFSIKEDGTPTIIAHNVKYVIDAEYCYGSDHCSQPLFLMEDGSLKVYISWVGDKDAPSDDTCHLVEPSYEGSYEKMR